MQFKILFAVIAVSFLLHFSSQIDTAYASEKQYLSNDQIQAFGFTSYEKINPNLLIYPLKRIAEEIKLKFIFSQNAKRDYLYKLYETRFNELVYIINNRKEGFLAFTADRYNSQVGTLKRENIKSEDFKIRIQSKVHFLERLRDIYPANSEIWIKLQQSIETTKSLI